MQYLRVVWVLISGMAALPLGCGDPNRQTIAEVRVMYGAFSQAVMSGLSTAERMELAQPDRPGPPAGADIPPGHPPVGSTVVPDDANTPAPTSANGSAFTWTLPEGWRELPSRPMRVATFAAGDAECYISVLAGDGGGTAANINRWRRQMGLDPLEDQAIGALPTLTVLNGPAIFVEMEGTYRDMSGSTLENAGFLGVVRPLDGQTLFIRMTGPAEAVRAQKAAFRAFCESLREASGS